MGKASSLVEFGFEFEFGLTGGVELPCLALTCLDLT